MGDTLVLTMGVALIGTLISAVLYGITITQTYLYFQRFPNDNVLIKLMVSRILFSKRTLSSNLVCQVATLWYVSPS